LEFFIVRSEAEAAAISAGLGGAFAAAVTGVAAFSGVVEE
jgi:hypothetical protein